MEIIAAIMDIFDDTSSSGNSDAEDELRMAFTAALEAVAEAVAEKVAEQVEEVLEDNIENL